MIKERYLTVAIHPSGIGKTGIFIKTFNGLYPQKWSITITTNNPLDAAHKIIEYIETIKNKLASNDYDLKEIIVELPSKNFTENSKEIIASIELIGMLRFYYEKKFRGHRSVDKNLGLLINSKTKTEQEKDAEAIMYAHFKEKEKHLICENAWLINTNKE